MTHSSARRSTAGLQPNEWVAERGGQTTDIGRERRRRFAALIMLGVSTVPFFPERAAAADTSSQTQMPAGASSAASADQPEQVTITGSRLPLSGTQSAQDVRIYDRVRIEQSGQSSVPDFLATLPEVSLNPVESSSIGTTVRLRGAARGSALVLINGRRTQSATGGNVSLGFFDLNTIPLSFVERIEVLPTGSSAVYGGDALSGVVNIILRSDFNGFEADAGYKYADNTDELIYSAAAGWKQNAFSASIMGTYSNRSALSGKDRAITASADFRAVGGPNLGLNLLGVPANVSSVSGNLPGLNSSFATVPKGSTGIGLTPASFAATAGTQTTGSFTAYQSVLGAMPRGGVFASASYRFASEFELFAELLWTAYKDKFVFTPPFLQFANVPTSNPFNPFGATVRVTGIVQGAENLARLSFNEDLVRPVIGARGNLGDWNWELTALTSRDKGESQTYGQPNNALLTAALASSNPAAALNPFVDGPMASDSLLASIYSTTTVTSFKVHTNIVNGFVRGPLLELPGGSLDAVLGGEYEDGELKRGFNDNRNAKSAFAELRAPLAGIDDERGGQRELLTLSGAVRYDDYSDFGAETTWQAGFEFRPLESLLLRASHATAFKPPTLFNLGAPRQTFPTALFDPKFNNQQVVVPVTNGGTQDLNPTTGTSTTAGLVWSPRDSHNFNLTITPWWLRIDNAIAQPNPQFVINNADLYPGRVVRAAAPPGQAGQLISVDASYVNFGSMRESGIDAGVDWTFATGFGDFTPAIAATYMTEYRGASTPGSAVVNRLSRANNDLNFAPRWKGTASIAWAPDAPFKLTFGGRYIGRYTDYTPPRMLGDFWYYDASLEIDMVRALHINPPLVSGIKLLVTATNLTDYLPPFSNYFRGYDPLNYDLVGRTIFVRLQIQT